ncbi:sulfurtransferase [Dechloromonas sp.]|uniref:sulfurtransferase n=1 Tax=Dechloromonas sp. TaxID=1917218 RepID=UPI0012156249|nr:sulfurtransferase [Dechloromonas sp.]MBU3695987.1 sulfurtransferase [Dechloromonas sp.]TEX47094.1 MAG: sulfurtransferase [Rhodocyclaceae bacterium]
MSFSTLIGVATLQANLENPDWRIVDVRHQLTDNGYGERAYAEAHIPGAVFMHCDRDLSGSMTGINGRHPLPDRDRLIARLGGIGIGPQTQVVVYDDAQGMIAGRLWWLLRWLGHEAVAVLDGGLQAWLAAGGVMSADVLPPRPAVFVAADPLTGLVTAGEVMDALGQPTMQVVDARAPDRFRGENETLDPVGGHIPGAINRFFRDNLEADGRFKAPAQLRAEWLARLAGIPPERVVHQCGSGVSACHNQLAMAVAGLSGSRLYAGSWSEWCADSGRPVAR